MTSCILAFGIADEKNSDVNLILFKKVTSFSLEAF